MRNVRAADGRDAGCVLKAVREHALLMRQLEAYAAACADDAARAEGSMWPGARRAEEFLRICRQEAAVHRQLEEAARRAMAGMKPEMYGFCVAYYLGGMNMREAAEMLERSERQCYRYRAALGDG